MKSTYYLFLCLCIPLFALTSCENDLEGDNFGQDTERYDIPLTSKSAEVNAKVQKFSFDFYREMARRQKADFCISPLSVNLCLGMVLNGADGNTYKEIQETLGYENFTYEEINAYAQMMQTELPKLDGRTIFTNANSVWVRNDFKVLESFVKTNKMYYNAEVYNEPLNDGTKDKVNRWCADKTNNLIQKILDDSSSDAVSLLINAIYFKGVWTSEFKEKDTKDEPFYLNSGEEIKVPTMRQENTTDCYVDDKVSVVELPYGNGAFSLVVFMPSADDEVALSRLIEGLDDTEWNHWIDKMKRQNLKLYLPRFKFESPSMDLKEIMRVMGISDAFDPVLADFSMMCDASVYVNEVKQKTFIEVNESGTEAAAVTMADMNLSMDSPAPTISELRFDHPFGYVLKEKSTGAILFAGRVDKPTI